LRRAEKNSAPSPGRLAFAYCVNNRNNNCGSFGGSVLLIAFRYSRSGKLVEAECDSSRPLCVSRKPATTSSNISPISNVIRTFRDIFTTLVRPSFYRLLPRWCCSRAGVGAAHQDSSAAAPPGDYNKMKQNNTAGMLCFALANSHSVRETANTQPPSCATE